jgi:hypothetical protein
MAQHNSFRGRRRRLNNANNRQNAKFRQFYSGARGFTRRAHEGLISAVRRWRLLIVSEP